MAVNIKIWPIAISSTTQKPSSMLPIPIGYLNYKFGSLWDKFYGFVRYQ